MTDEQAKFYTMYLVALCKVNRLANTLVSSMQAIHNHEVELDRLRECLSVCSHEHGLAVADFLRIDNACSRMGVTRRMTLKQAKAYG